MKTQLHKSLKIVFLYAIFFSLSSTFAQAPQKMSYQAVVRNASNALVANTNVGVKVSVLQNSATGTVVYSEAHSSTTNVNGLATFEIGNGTILSGNFATINWENGPYFIKTETDPTGGTNYTISGTSQLLSVPFALYAASGNAGPQGLQGIPGVAGPQGPIGLTGATGPQGSFPSGTNVGDMQYWNGTNWIMIPIGLPGQFLQINSLNVPEWQTTSLSYGGLDVFIIVDGTTEILQGASIGIATTPENLTNGIYIANNYTNSDGYTSFNLSSGYYYCNCYYALGNGEYYYGEGQVSVAYGANQTLTITVHHS